MTKPNRVLMQFGNDVYAFVVNEDLTCDDCDFEEDDCHMFPMCAGLDISIGSGVFQRRNYKITIGE